MTLLTLEEMEREVWNLCEDLYEFLEMQMNEYKLL